MAWPSADEKRQLARAFGCAIKDVDDAIERCVTAAREEYLRMILGQRVFTRGQDIREYRLYLMIRHVFHGRLPTEPQISALFQTTATQSRALLRAVMSKYQYDLQDPILDTLRDELRRGQPDPNTPGGLLLTVDSENVIDALNRELGSIDGTLSQVTKARNTVSTYEVPAASYKALQQHLGLS